MHKHFLPKQHTNSHSASAIICNIAVNSEFSSEKHVPKSESLRFITAPNIALLSVKSPFGVSPSQNQLDQLANIWHFRWGQKDGGLPLEFYRKNLSERFSNTHTPMFAVLDSDCNIAGATFPLRHQGVFSISDSSKLVLPETHDLVTGNKTYLTDNPDGRILVCPEIAVVSGKGTPRTLIVDGVLPYARYLHSEKKIDSLIAYSRPSDYSLHQNQYPNILEYLATNEKLVSENQRALDTNIAMHLKFNAKISRVHANGCPLDKAACGFIVEMDYTHLLQ